MTTRIGRIFRKRSLLFWAILLLCCAILTSGQWALERQRRRAEAVERDFQDRLEAVYRVVMPYRDQSAAQVAAGLNGGRPLGGQAGEEARPVATLAGTMFDDRSALPPGVSPLAPAPSFRAELPGRVIGPGLNDWVIHLHFVDGKLAGAYAITPPHAVHRGPSAGWVTMQLALAGLVYVGAGTWCLSALLLPFNRPWRWQIAQAALAGLLVAALAQALGPGWSLPPLSSSGILHARLLLTIVAAGLLGLVSLMVPPRKMRARVGVAPCAHCGYDLTGNISGRCPECGHNTPQGLIDRWSDQANRVAQVEDVGTDDTQGDRSLETGSAEAESTIDPPEGDEDQERPPVLAPWVSFRIVHLEISDVSEQRQPKVQAPVGVPGI